MTGNAPGRPRILGTLRSDGGDGVVRMEDRFDTDIDDLWSALTDPARLSRWHSRVEGRPAPRRDLPPTATRPFWWSSSGDCPCPCFPPTAPASSCTSRTWPTTSVVVSSQIPRPGGRSSYPPIATWGPTSASSPGSRGTLTP
jgi:hypothetical protein